MVFKFLKVDDITWREKDERGNRGRLGHQYIHVAPPGEETVKGDGQGCPMRWRKTKKARLCGS